MEPLVIGKSRAFLWIIAVASAGMALAGLLLVLQGSVAGWPALIFFGAGTLSIAYQARQRGPRVVIDEAGVFDRTLGVGVIPWYTLKTRGRHGLPLALLLMLAIIGPLSLAVVFEVARSLKAR